MKGGGVAGDRSVDEVLRRIVMLDLPGAPTDEVDLSAGGQSADVARSLVAEAEARGLIGSLWLAAGTGAVVLPGEAADRLADRHRAVMLWCLHLEMRLLEVQEWFAEVGGIDAIVLKGPAVAHLDEVDPSVRSFADIDLLVAGEDVDRAVAVIEDHGATRPWPERRPGYDRRFAKSVTLTCRDGVEIDLHRSLVDGVHGFRIPLPELFDQKEQFVLGGTEFAALCRAHRLLHAAYHVLLGSPVPPTTGLRDLARFLARPDFGPEVVLPIARRWRGEAVLAQAVRLVLEELPLEVPDWKRWVDGVQVDPREVAIMDRHRAEGSSLGRAKLDALRELPGTRSKVAYAAALAWPSRDHLESRGRHRRDVVASWRGFGLRTDRRQGR